MTRSISSVQSDGVEKPAVLTMGDPGGIAAEITVAAWRALRNSGAAFFVLADPAIFRDLHVPVANIEAPPRAMAHFKSALPVMALNTQVTAKLGSSDGVNAAAIIESIKRAVSFCLADQACAVITNPIQKSTLMAGGFSFPGHTEFLAALTRETPMPNHRERGPVMMLTGPSLKTVPVTIHQSVKEAISNLTAEKIVHTAVVTHEALRFELGISAPRLAISGLNPHAGEQGMMGTEDIMIIEPAIAMLRERGINAVGPLPADTMFHATARSSYDAAICMLHDQALIPVKTLAFDEAVNTTLGLPIIRTSPDHGTALDIAGKGKANASSLTAAIKLAIEFAARRSIQRNASR